MAGLLSSKRAFKAPTETIGFHESRFFLNKKEKKLKHAHFLLNQCKTFSISGRYLKLNISINKHWSKGSGTIMSKLREDKSWDLLNLGTASKANIKAYIKVLLYT